MTFSPHTLNSPDVIFFSERIARMNWNDNEGPWGPGKGSSDNEKRPESPWPPKGFGSKNHGPDNGPLPPDFDELWRIIKKNLGPLKPRNYLQAVGMALSLVFGLWLLSGFYMVDANQMGVVMRLGAFNRTELPGLHYHLPAPIEEILLPVVTAENEIQIGFRRFSRGGEGAQPVPQESLMLTGDENIVNVEYTVFWRINDVSNYLFEIRAPQTTIKMAAESVMREVIGQNDLEFTRTNGRTQIAEEARKRLQLLLDEYKAGIIVTQVNLQEVAVPEEVKDAFQDVVNARLDMERFQNQAAAHVNKVIPEAKGQAAKLVQESMAYRDQKIAIAKGEAARFTEVLAAYQGSRDVTTKRLYLEMMETVLGRAQKIITDGASGTVPLYPLQDLMSKKKNSEKGDQP